MICPLKFNGTTLDRVGFHYEGKLECEQASCAWWNERFGMCSLAVDAYLKGQEDWRREKEIIRKGG